jgi:hypothetical protein
MGKPRGRWGGCCLEGCHRLLQTRNWEAAARKTASWGGQGQGPKMGQSAREKEEESIFTSVNTMRMSNSMFSYAFIFLMGFLFFEKRF